MNHAKEYPMPAYVILTRTGHLVRQAAVYPDDGKPRRLAIGIEALDVEEPERATLYADRRDARGARNAMFASPANRYAVAIPAAMPIVRDSIEKRREFFQAMAACGPLP
jgi:hypothetical protein